VSNLNVNRNTRRIAMHGGDVQRLNLSVGLSPAVLVPVKRWSRWEVSGRTAASGGRESART